MNTPSKPPRQAWLIKIFQSLWRVITSISSLFAKYGHQLYQASFGKVLYRNVEREQSSMANNLAFLLTIAGIASGMATYAALGTSALEDGGDPDRVFWLLNIDLIILLMLVMLVARRLVSLFSGRRRGIAGSKLHVRLVFLFSLLAAAPSIIMAIFSAFFFHYGIQSWFGERIQTAVSESQAVAQAYLEEHTQVIRADILGSANDMEREAVHLVGNNAAINRMLQTQSFLRNFSEIALVDSQGRVLSSAGLVLNTDLIQDIPAQELAEASRGDVAIMTGQDEDRVRALVKLNSFVDTFLFVGRLVDPKVLSHVDSTRQAVEAYDQLEGAQFNLQVTFLLIYVVVALLLLLAAIWMGLVFARQMIMPISSIISAAERVRAGDLTARIPEHEGFDEFEYLNQSFNRMTKQIQQQRDELVQTNRQLDERRRFTETVLAGVSSGVIGASADGQITLVNGMARRLMGLPLDDLIGKNIKDFLPDIAALINDRLDNENGKANQQTQITYSSPKDSATKTFLVRVEISQEDDNNNENQSRKTRKNIVITFDDITDFLSAQRKAAWADVARRIAHEIKNPLTPIQLSAERLERKYLKQIQSDPDTFKNCVQTIIKHVSDIGHMVNEFSSFARMPNPVFKHENVSQLIKDQVLFEKQVHQNIDFEYVTTDDQGQDFFACCDAQKIRQAFVNILKNAVESVQENADALHDNANANANASSDKSDKRGKIVTFISRSDKNELSIIVTDNGIGFPKDEDITRLMDPYVTKREKGTGLGLAIVKKIMEDHQGELILGEQPWQKKHQEWLDMTKDMHGATVILTMPLITEQCQDGEDQRNNDQNNKKKDMVG